MIHTSLKKILLLGLFCGSFLAPEAKAVLLGFDSPLVVGKIVDGIPSNPADEVTYINNLLGLNVLNTATVIGTETYTKINPYGGTVNTTGAFKDESGPLSFTMAAGYAYILGKYGNDGSYVWYIGDIAVGTSITLPSSFEGTGAGLSHISAYRGVTQQVPDGGLTVALLGSTLGAIGLARRYFGKAK